MGLVVVPGGLDCRVLSDQLSQLEWRKGPSLSLVILSVQFVGGTLNDPAEP